MNSRTTSAAAFVAILSMSVLSLAANATEFTAAPMNSGPPIVTIPVLSQVVGVVNTVTQPVLQPILAPSGAMAAPMASAPKRHRRHHVAKLMHKAA